MKTIAEETRSEIVACYKTGKSMREVGEMYHVSQSTVSRIVRENNYDRSHVGGTVARSVALPPSFEMPVGNAPKAADATSMKPSDCLITTRRTMYIQGADTDFTYVIDTDNDHIQMDINGFEIALSNTTLSDFIEELRCIESLLGKRH